MVPFSSVLVFANPSCFCGSFIYVKIMKSLTYSFKVILTLNKLKKKKKLRRNKQAIDMLFVCDYMQLSISM